jgi:hypothetical protein
MATAIVMMITLVIIPCNRNATYVECKNKSDTGNDRGNWNCFEIIQEMSEQDTWKALNQGTAENSHIGHSTHTAESAD